MVNAASAKVIDFAPYLQRSRRAHRRDMMYTALALWTQYASLGVLVLYGLLRLVLCPQVAPGSYSGPLAVLWPVSFVLLLTSYVSDLVLWRDE